MNRSFLALALVVVTLNSSPVRAATQYVKSDGGNTSCNSWANACGVGYVYSHAQSGDQIWFKAGTYPSLVLVNGVMMIGGFAGTETAASQSNPAVNETIIDGEDSSQAVFSQDVSSSAVLRGFTIMNGYEDTWDGGGGLLVMNSSSIFANCIFRNNNAVRVGAAISVRGASSPSFINCKFYDNGLGKPPSIPRVMGAGVVYMYGGSATFVNCLFYNNQADEGGVAVTISGTPTFINCTMHDNHAIIGIGGAISDSLGNATIKNCIIWGNTAASSQSAQIFNGPFTPGTVLYSDVQGGWPGTGNINFDPLFQSAGSRNYKLQTTSPCINKGQKSALSSDIANLDWDIDTGETTPLDLALVARVSGTTTISCNKVDLGAYEVQTGVCSGGDGGGQN